MSRNGIRSTVTGTYYFYIRTRKKNYYKGGYASYEEADIDKEIYYWGRDYLRRRKELNGKKESGCHTVQYYERFRR